MKTNPYELYVEDFRMTIRLGRSIVTLPSPFAVFSLQNVLSSLSKTLNEPSNGWIREVFVLTQRKIWKQDYRSWNIKFIFGMIFQVKHIVWPTGGHAIFNMLNNKFFKLLFNHIEHFLWVIFISIMLSLKMLQAHNFKKRLLKLNSIYINSLSVNNTALYNFT